MRVCVSRPCLFAYTGAVVEQELGKRQAETAALVGPVEVYNKAAAVVERNRIADTPYTGT